MIVALALTAAAALAALVRYELRRVDPLIEPRFFTSRPFSAATLIAVAAFAAFGGFLFLNTLYLQDVRGLSPLSAGLLHAAHGGHDRAVQPDLRPGRRHARGARPAGRRRPRAGRRQPDAGVAQRRTPRWEWLLAAYSVFGLGFGAVNPPITNAAVSGMPPSRPGWPRRWPRRAARSASRSASPWSARWSPRGWTARSTTISRRPATWRGGSSPPSGAGIVVLGLGREHGGGPGRRRADRGAAGRGAAGGVMGRRRGGPRASRLACDVRRRARSRPQGRGVRDALGLSWTRVLALRRLAPEPLHAARSRRAARGRPAVRHADGRRPREARAGAAPSLIPRTGGPSWCT